MVNMINTHVLSDSLVIHDEDVVRISIQNLYLDHDPNNHNSDETIYLKPLNTKSAHQKFVVKILDSGSVAFYQKSSDPNWVTMVCLDTSYVTKVVNGQKIKTLALCGSVMSRVYVDGDNFYFSLIPHGGKDLTIMGENHTHWIRCGDRVVAGDSSEAGGQKYDDLKFEIHPVNDSKPILVRDKLTFNHY